MAQLGNPFIAAVPKQLSGGELAQAIRADIAGEWEAIIGYEAHAMATTDERVKKILYHIAEEEKHHVGELQELLAILKTPKKVKSSRRANKRSRRPGPIIFSSCSK